MPAAKKPAPAAKVPARARKRKPLKKGRAVYVRFARAKEFLRFFIAKHKIVCWHCGEPVPLHEFDQWQDTLTLHHKNMNHEDNRVANLEVVHRGCHRSLHAAHAKRGKRGVNRLTGTRFGAEHVREAKSRMRAARR